MHAENVVVEEITATADRLITTAKPHGINLGNASIEKRVGDIIQKMRQRGRVFLVNWDGDKIPEGAQVGEFIITWTQHGVVSGMTVDEFRILKETHPPDPRVGGNMFISGTTALAAEAVRIGTYDRLEEFVGEGRNHHRMIVYLYPEPLVSL